MRDVSLAELEDTLRAHETWLKTGEMEGERADFSHRSLAGKDLSSAELTHARFLETDLRGVLLDGANLGKSTFNKALLQSAQMKKVDLSGASLVDCDLTAVCLAESQLIGAIFSSSNLDDSDFTAVHAHSANFNRVVGTGMCFRRANAPEAKFFNANLGEAVFADAELTSSDFSNANVGRCDFRGANLSAARLINSFAEGAEFSGANLWEIQKDKWQIAGAKCDFVYIDVDGTDRFPRDRSFRLGEFEKTFAWLPNFKTTFPDLNPLDPFVVSLIVDALNRQMPELALNIENLSLKGIEPFMTFTVGDESRLLDAKNIVSLAIQELRPALLEEIQSQFFRTQEAIAGDIDDKVMRMSVENINVFGNVGNLITGHAASVEIIHNDGAVTSKKVSVEDIEALIKAIEGTSESSNFTDKTKEKIKEELSAILAGEVRQISQSTIEMMKKAGPTVAEYISNLFG